MDLTIFSVIGPGELAFIVGLAVFAGWIKGSVGFAMPMILLSGLGSVLAPEIAIAGLILPTLFTNLWQALRQGVRAAWSSVRLYWRFLLPLMGMIVIAAQFVTGLSESALFLVLGIPVTLFATIQLAGWRPRIAASWRRASEVGVGFVAGTIGGLCGVWGPPTVLYLTALETPKVEQMRVQGVIYGVGAVVLTGAHIRSGVLNTETVPLSMLLLAPALLGMALGFAFQDRIDQALFRRLTLLVLVVAGLNLIRRGLFA